MPITTCDSPEILRAEIDSIRKKVTPDETEETWDTIAQGIMNLTLLCNIGACQFPSELVPAIRSLSRPLVNALNSERSRLSGAAIEFIAALAVGLESSFEPLVSHFVPTILALCGRTNKVFTSRARACILAIVQHTHLPCLLPYLAELANHKSMFPRLIAAEGMLACLNCFNPPDLEKETRARIVENFIKSTARDANADVRKASKEVFKAYRILLPARVESFVAPLTPVVKKYLDIQAGPSGVLSNATQKPASRPPSRTNNKATEASKQASSSALSKPPTRLPTDDLIHGTKRQAPVHILPIVSDVRGPQQKTTSRVQREPSSHSLQTNIQSSSAAQRCVIPKSAPARQAVQHPAPGLTRVLPARNAPTGGPQRPPSMPMKLTSAPDRFKVTGNGAKRVPLPSVPISGQSGEQVVALAKLADRPGSSVEEQQPGRSSEAMAPAKLAPGQKVLEGSRPVPFHTKPTSKPAMTAQPDKKPPIKAKTSDPNGAASRRHPEKNMQKGTRPLVKTERKEMSPALVPLPPSPSISPTEIPLPPSPDHTSHHDAVVGVSSELVDELPRPTEQDQGSTGLPSTPITALLSSIQRGFLFTPSSPLSPPHHYLLASSVPRKEQEVVGEVKKGSLAPFCMPLEDGDGLDRYALKDLN